jgi:hypothetical protein
MYQRALGADYDEMAAAAQDCIQHALADGSMSRDEFKSCAAAAAGAAAAAYCTAEAGPVAGGLCGEAAAFLAEEIAGPIYDAASETVKAIGGFVDDIFGGSGCSGFCISGVHWSRLGAARQLELCGEWYPAWPRPVPLDVRASCVRRLALAHDQQVQVANQMAFATNAAYWAIIRAVSEGLEDAAKQYNQGFAAPRTDQVEGTLAVLVSELGDDLIFSKKHLKAANPSLFRPDGGFNFSYIQSSPEVALRYLVRWTDGVRVASILAAGYVGQQAAQMSQTQVAMNAEDAKQRETFAPQGGGGSVVPLLIGAGVVAGGLYLWHRNASR